MAKRFIDTELFNDEWVHDLSKDGKLFFLYYITTCDHAGVLRLNKKLCEFQTGLKNIETLIKEFGKSLVTVKEGLYFMPRFIKFQYPKFPQSTVKQQEGAINILKQLGFWDEQNNTYLTLSKELSDSYVYVSDNVILKEKEEKIYRKFAHLSLSESEFAEIQELGYAKQEIDAILDDIENYKKNAKYKSLCLTAKKWLKKNKDERGSIIFPPTMSTLEKNLSMLKMLPNALRGEKISDFAKLDKKNGSAEINYTEEFLKKYNEPCL